MNRRTGSNFSTHRLVGMADIPLLPVTRDGAEVGGGAASPKKKKTMTSLYLTFFETAADGKNRACRLCNKTYCLSTATSKQSTHPTPNPFFYLMLHIKNTV